MEIYLFLFRVYNLWESHARSCQNYCEDFKRWRSPPTCDRTKGVLWCLVELVNTLTTQRNADTDTLIHVPIVPLILAIPSVSPWKQSRPICFKCRGFARLWSHGLLKCSRGTNRANRFFSWDRRHCQWARPCVDRAEWTVFVAVHGNLIWPTSN